MKYGDKRDYPAIDIYVWGRYECTTTWARTLRIAKAAFFEKSNVHIDAIHVQFKDHISKRKRAA